MFLGVLGFFSLPHPTILVTCLLCAGKYTPNNTPLKVLRFTYELKTNSRAEHFLSPRSSRNPRPRAEFVQQQSLCHSTCEPELTPTSTCTSELAPTYHSRVGLSLSRSLPWRSERRSQPAPQPSPENLNSDLAYSPGRQSTFPPQSCPGTITPIYRLVPPACKCHGDDGCAPREAQRGTRRGHRCSAAKGRRLALHLPQTWLGLTL